MDHFAECRPTIQAYYACLQQSEYVAPRCRKEQRDYLQCRMDRGMMGKEDVENYGIPTTQFDESVYQEFNTWLGMLRGMSGSDAWSKLAKMKRERLDRSRAAAVEKAEKEAAAGVAPAPAPAPVASS